MLENWILGKIFEHLKPFGFINICQAPGIGDEERQGKTRDTDFVKV